MNIAACPAPLILSAALSFALAAPSLAQCSTAWQATNLGLGTNGAVRALQSWDSDGSGPLPPTIAIGGSFSQAGSSATDNLAFYDPATQILTAPIVSPSGTVRALLDGGSGQLIVAGEFASVGGVAGTSGIAVWDGNSWSSLGGGVQGQVYAMARMANGDLLVGGSFATAGSAGLATNSVARWDGVAWRALGAGVSGTAPSVQCLIERLNGDIIVGGGFTTAGSVAARGVASWDGSSWRAFDAGISALHFRASKLVVRTNGSLLLVAFGLGSGLYEFINGTWTTMAGAPGNVVEIYEAASGVIYAGQSGNVLIPAGVSEFRQGVWSSLAMSTGPSLPLRFAAIQSLPGGNPDDLIIGGSFQNVNGVRSRNLGTWIGGTWSGSPNSENVNGPVSGFATGSDGTIYACGDFTEVDGMPAARVARSIGSSWQQMGSGMNQRVASIAVAANGDVYAVGQFTIAGGVSCNGFARWDGSSWSPVAGFAIPPLGLLKRRNGNLVTWGMGVAISELTANGWVPFTSNRYVQVMVELPDGRLAASGNDQQWGPAGSPYTRTAIWDGTTWENTIYQHSWPDALGFTSNGDLVVSASFNPPFQGQNVARWDGASWQSMAGGLPSPPTALATLPNGELIASGYFDGLGGAPTASLASFDGTVWSPLPVVSTSVSSLHVSPIGTLFVGSSLYDPSINRLTTSCPATAVSIPSGCAGPLPSPQLQTTQWPYLGSNYQAYVTDLQTGSLLLSAYGLVNTNTLLSSLLPSAVPGCLLRTDPLFSNLVITQNGSTATQLSIQASSALVGMSFQQQIVELTFDIQGNISSTQTSNALQLTIGSF